MSFCERISNFFKELYPRNEKEAVKKEEPELDTTVHNETKPVVEEKNPLTIEDVDTDGSEYEMPFEEKNDVLEFDYEEEEQVDEVRPTSDEFDCDERELVEILEEKEKEEDEDHHRFSMC